MSSRNLQHQHWPPSGPLSDPPRPVGEVVLESSEQSQSHFFVRTPIIKTHYNLLWLPKITILTFRTPSSLDPSIRPDPHTDTDAAYPFGGTAPRQVGKRAATRSVGSIAGRRLLCPVPVP